MSTIDQTAHDGAVTLERRRRHHPSVWRLAKWGEDMELTVGLIEGLAVIGVVCWLVSKVLSSPCRSSGRGQEKMCEPWWKASHR